ncbi:MAG: glycosyltransferase, partial [Mycobacteriaceae bacterium]
MRVAVVAGPDPGHAFPAIALCLKFLQAGDTPILFTGDRWLQSARSAGIQVVELKGLLPRAQDNDDDAGHKIHQRAAHMASCILADLERLNLDLIVSDVITAGGGMAAELLAIPWIELSPHPLYLPSKGLPPIGSGLAPGAGVRGRVRDAVMRWLTNRSIRKGQCERADAREKIGLPRPDPGPLARLIATLPTLEMPRPDWPENAFVVGPLHWEPTQELFEVPSGVGPLIVIAPSTAHTGAVGLFETAVEALNPLVKKSHSMRVVVSTLDGNSKAIPSWVRCGLGRQDVLLQQADVV